MNKINNYIIYIGNCLKFWRISRFSPNNNSEFMETIKSFKTFKSEIEKDFKNVPEWFIKHLYKRYTLNRTINQIIKRAL